MSGTTINEQAISIQPYVFVDTSGTTIYTGTSISFSNGASANWRIKKEWTIGTVKYMGFPNGDQSFSFIWNSRAGYTYK
jgi:hypothetical protein